MTAGPGISSSSGENEVSFYKRYCFSFVMQPYVMAAGGSYLRGQE